MTTVRSNGRLSARQHSQPDRCGLTIAGLAHRLLDELLRHWSRGAWVTVLVRHAHVAFVLKGHTVDTVAVSGMAGAIKSRKCRLLLCPALPPVAQQALFESARLGTGCAAGNTRTYEAPRALGAIA